MGFWKANAGKVSLLAVLLIAAGFFTFRNCRSETIQRPDSIAFVCATTGKVYHLARDGKARPVPFENPETHTATLFPCVERDGGIFVSSRYRGMLRELKDANKAVDLDTLQVHSVN